MSKNNEEILHSKLICQLFMVLPSSRATEKETSYLSEYKKIILFPIIRCRLEI